MRNLLVTFFSAVMLLACQPLGAQTFTIDGSFALDSSDAEPVVMFDRSATRAHAFWAARGSIEAVRLSGASVGRRSVLMPGRSDCSGRARCVTYAHASAASLPDADGLVVAAEQRYYLDRGFDHPNGRGFGFPVQYPQIELLLMTADHRVQWRQVLDPRPGNGMLGARRPSVAVDEASVMVAFTDTIPEGALRSHIFVQQLARDGTVLSGPTAVPTPAATFADNTALAAAAGEFLLVYETDQDLRAQRIDAFSGQLLGSQLIAAKRRGESEPTGHPTLIYSAVQQRFYVAWREDDRIRLLSLNRQGRPLHSPIDLPPACSGIACWFSSRVEGRPSLSLSPDQSEVNVAFSARPLLDVRMLGVVSYSVSARATASDVPSSRWLVGPADGPATEATHAVSAANPIYAVYRKGNRLYARFHPN